MRKHLHLNSTTSPPVDHRMVVEHAEFETPENKTSKPTKWRLPLKHKNLIRASWLKILSHTAYCKSKIPNFLINQQIQYGTLIIQWWLWVFVKDSVVSYICTVNYPCFGFFC
jgi:hypothetical protein